MFCLLQIIFIWIGGVKKGREGEFTLSIVSYYKNKNCNDSFFWIHDNFEWVGGDTYILIWSEQLLQALMKMSYICLWQVILATNCINKHELVEKM